MINFKFYKQYKLKNRYCLGKILDISQGDLILIKLTEKSASEFLKIADNL
jgi:hypothetical protein